MNDTQEGTQGVGNPDLSGCLSFEKYPVGTTFGLNFTLGWFRFSALSAIQPQVYHYDTTPPTGHRIGLAPYYPGLLIDLPTPVQQLGLVIGMNSGQPIYLVALDAAGAEVSVGLNAHHEEVKSVTIPEGHSIYNVPLRSRWAPIVQVRIMGGTGEDVLLQICLDPQKVEQLFEDTTDVAKIDKEEIKKILEDPKAKAILDDIERDFRRLEGGGGSGGGGGLGFDFGINWPPDWLCIARNIALMAAASFLATLIVPTIGAVTLSGLAQDAAIALLMSTFGISGATAEVVWLIFGGKSWMAIAVDRCS